MTIWLKIESKYCVFLFILSVTNQKLTMITILGVVFLMLLELKYFFLKCSVNKVWIMNKIENIISCKYYNLNFWYTLEPRYVKLLALSRTEIHFPWICFLVVCYQLSWTGLPDFSNKFSFPLRVRDSRIQL